MIFDIHGHYGYSFFPIEVEKEDALIKLMDFYNIDKCIISNFRGIFYELPGANEEVKNAIAKYPDRLFGHIVVNPNYNDKSLEDIDTYSGIPGFIGIKIHPAWHGVPVNSDLYRPIFELAEEKMLPILAHSFISESLGDQVSAPERLADAASRYKNPIIMGHMGGNHSRGIAAAKGIKNLYVEISGGRQDADSPSVWRTERVEQAVEELGIEKVMFGSDLPLVEPAISMGIVDDADLTREQREMIMYKNAEKIFFNNKGAAE